MSGGIIGLKHWAHAVLEVALIIALITYVSWFSAYKQAEISLFQQVAKHRAERSATRLREDCSKLL